MVKNKLNKFIPLIIVILMLISFLYLNNKIDNLDLIKEKKIIITNNFSDNIKTVKPSVLLVLSEVQAPEKNYMSGEYVFLNNKAYLPGSGFFISDDGYILTAYHVIKDNSGKVFVGNYRNNKPNVIEAELISVNKGADIALLKIEGKNLPHVTLGDYEKFSEGMDIGFIGYPLDLTVPITHKGVISGKGKMLYEDGNEPINVFLINAFVNKGNSGGPLFSADTGEVIGIINARKNAELDKKEMLKLPEDYSPIMTIGGVDPITLSVETYNRNLRYIGKVSQVGIGYSTSIEYGKELLEAAR